MIQIIQQRRDGQASFELFYDHVWRIYAIQSHFLLLLYASVLQNVATGDCSPPASPPRRGGVVSSAASSRFPRRFLRRRMPS